jgi:hypothetical protein
MIFQKAGQNIEELKKPWPDNFADWLHNLGKYPTELNGIVEEAQDERPIQQYLENNPVVISLILGGGHGRWVFPKPKLGCEYVPDFMLCERDSAGYHWQLVELESPTLKALTQSGQSTSQLTHAKHQIDQWRIWLRQNVQYAQNELRYIHLDCEFLGVIIIGRREERNTEFQRYYRELSDDKLTIMSYDRLLDKVNDAARFRP